MNHFLLVLRFLTALSLTAALPGQRPTSEDLGLRPELAASILAGYWTAPDKPEWKSAFTLGAMASSGNTRRRSANAAAEAERRAGPHRSSAKAAWNYAQTKATGSASSGGYELDQRHSQGNLKQDYFISKKSFLFVGTEATNDYDRNLALRLTTTTGIGVQLIDAAATRYAIEIGVGYYGEESRIANTQTNGYATGKVVSSFERQFDDTWQLLSTITYLPSLDDQDELSGTSDTRLRAKMAKGMFAQLQWIVDYDNTPLADVAGNPNTRIDHQFFLSVGWSF
ncbi:MAG: DUF481 domain-containing protein [Planctomycetota bacterium]|nr:DUF481 domain-containing protein [Planctomycetota bacterium]